MTRASIFLALVFFGGSYAHAGIISIITGADMAEMEVTATFEDGSTEMATWAVVNDPGGVPTTIQDAEDYAGEARGSNFVLYQQGETFGDFDGSTNTFFGEWVLSNLDQTTRALTGVVINALAGGIVFDNVEDTEETPGSEMGRFYTGSIPGVQASYTDAYSSPDLFGTLALSNFSLAANNELRFQTDTDKIPLPGTALLLLVGALGFARRKLVGRG